MQPALVGTFNCIRQVAIWDAYNHYFAPGRDAKYRNEYVSLFSLFVGLYLSAHTCTVYLENQVHVAMAWSCCDDTAMRYLLPVLWLMSCFHLWYICAIFVHVYGAVNSQKLMPEYEKYNELQVKSRATSRCDECVCLSVCLSLSVHSYISKKPRGRTSPNF